MLTRRAWGFADSARCLGLAGWAVWAVIAPPVALLMVPGTIIWCRMWSPKRRRPPGVTPKAV